MEKTMKKDVDIKAKIARVITYLFLIILSITCVIPFLWMVSSSLKLDRMVYKIPIQWIPNPVRWENYTEIFKEVPFFRFFINSLKIAVTVTFVQLLTSSMAAFSFSKLRFPGSNRIFMLYLATMMVPSQVTLIPQFLIVKGLGMFDTHMALILIAAFSPFGVFMLTQFFKGISSELIEAAKIDGAGLFDTYLRIIVPLARPALSALGILTFIWQMNDFMNPMIYINKIELRTVTLGIRMFANEYFQRSALQMSATMVGLVPVIIMYVVAQKQIIQGIAFNAGLKG